MPRRPGRAQALLLLVVGGIMIVAALPRIASSVAALPGDGSMARLRRGDVLDAAALGLIIRSREAAVSLEPSGGRWHELALARMHMLDRRRAIRAERDLPHVRDDLVRALALAPANPYAWTALASIDIALGRAAGGPVLDLALRTGPFERSLAAARVALAIDAPDRVADLPMLYRQLSWAWTVDSEGVLAAVRATGASEELRAALQDRPEELRRLDALLR